MSVEAPVPDPTAEPAEDTAAGKKAAAPSEDDPDSLDSVDDLNELQRVQRDLKIEPRVLTMWECFKWINRHMWDNLGSDYLAFVNIAFASLWAIYQPIIMGARTSPLHGSSGAPLEDKRAPPLPFADR